MNFLTLIKFSNEYEHDENYFTHDLCWNFHCPLKKSHPKTVPIPTPKIKSTLSLENCKVSHQKCFHCVWWHETWLCFLPHFSCENKSYFTHLLLPFVFLKHFRNAVQLHKAQINTHSIFTRPPHPLTQQQHSTKQ